MKPLPAVATRGGQGEAFDRWIEMHRVRYEVEKRGQGMPVHAVKPVWGKTCVCVGTGTVGGWGHGRRPSWPQRPEVPVRPSWKQSLSLSRTFSSVALVGWDGLLHTSCPSQQSRRGNRVLLRGCRAPKKTSAGRGCPEATEPRQTSRCGGSASPQLGTPSGSAGPGKVR